MFVGRFYILNKNHNWTFLLHEFFFFPFFFARIFFLGIFPCMNFFLAFSPPPPPPITFLMVRPLVSPAISLVGFSYTLTLSPSQKLLHNRIKERKVGNEKKNENGEKEGAGNDGKSEESLISLFSIPIVPRAPRYFTLPSPLFVSARARKRPLRRGKPFTCTWLNPPDWGKIKIFQSPPPPPLIKLRLGHHIYRNDSKVEPLLLFWNLSQE